MRPYAQVHGMFMAILISLPLATHAQGPAVVPQNQEPPTSVKATAQPWLVQQEWYCRPANLQPNTFANNVRARLSTLGAAGWEIVSFSAATIAGQECFVGTFKAPKK